MDSAKRPLLIVALGLKNIFAAHAPNVIAFYEIREIDPTVPGHPEYEAMISDPNILGPSPVRLVCIDGQRLDY